MGVAVSRERGIEAPHEPGIPIAKFGPFADAVALQIMQGKSAACLMQAIPFARNPGLQVILARCIRQVISKKRPQGCDELLIGSLSTPRAIPSK